jgi:hypothetical protein
VDPDRHGRPIFYKPLTSRRNGRKSGFGGPASGDFRGPEGGGEVARRAIAGGDDGGAGWSGQMCSFSTSSSMFCM